MQFKKVKKVKGLLVDGDGKGYLIPEYQQEILFKAGSVRNQVLNIVFYIRRGENGND